MPGGHNPPGGLHPTRRTTMRTFIAGIILAVSSATALASEPAVSESTTEYQAEAIQDQLKSYLFTAAREGDTEILQVFIESGYALITRVTKGYHVLFNAVY